MSSNGISVTIVPDWIEKRLIFLNIYKLGFLEEKGELESINNITFGDIERIYE